MAEKEIVELFCWEYEGEFEQTFFVVNSKQEFIKTLKQLLTKYINIKPIELKKYIKFKNSDWIPEPNYATDLFFMIETDLSKKYDTLKVDLNHNSYVNHLNETFFVQDNLIVQLRETNVEFVNI